ncbi:alpha/beta hydrolase [Streptomyces camponoticapitis]|uniref:Alpha/beta hydrolase n=1 Tax=Streptomyces camponoticapitis TaxID=1616125 RepID=A0ABQ2EWF9_9ACTN|nr:alpha/beta hydrolase [Streptomyces camponoticapitis]GGK24978.1 alpha/beta hydrolase [Streptomyces camponoticapitis]
MKRSRKILIPTAGALAAAAVVAAVAINAGTASATASHPAPHRPTVVLVHGAFEDASSFAGVTTELQRDGYTVVAPAVPLRGLAQDSAYVANVVRSIDGPVVLAGHSYGGMLISEVAAQVPDVHALVYAAAFIPRRGESLQDLNEKYPGSLLGPDTTFTVNQADGPELHVKAESFRSVFAADRTAGDAAVAAAGQRPVLASALGDKAQHDSPSSVPVYSIITTQDKAIPPAVQEFMAHRDHARTWKVRSAHDVTTTHSQLVASVIEQAAGRNR